MKVIDALNNGIKILNNKDVEEASLQARILLSSILICRKEELIIRANEEIEKDKEEIFFEGIDKISKGYPVQYLTNCKEFMGMNFYVEEGVLVPRSDTEILAQEAIKLSKENKKDILELCTGSGIISIAIAKYAEKSKITATDISEKALEIAKKNAKRLIEEDNINFVKSDMFEKVDGKFDIIVSNPPYIKTNVIKDYKLEFEPKLALDGGEDGLKFYRIIIKEGYKYLKSNGIILLEIGYDQKEEVIELVKKNGNYKDSFCIKDLSGNDRVIIIKF